MDKELHLIFATGNPNKLLELSQMLAGLDMQLESLNDIGWRTEIEETGSTLEENALIKARTIYAHTGKNVFAEDTGLEVFALDMAPGVHTARYAGAQRKASDNMNLLLTNLSSVQDRRARFRTVISLIWDDREYLFEGICEGKIITSKRGDGGFGYDPVFMPDGYDLTFGELSSEIKNRISHRYRALEKMLLFLKDKVVI